jgi:hypothetical protein
MIVCLVQRATVVCLLLAGLTVAVMTQSGDRRGAAYYRSSVTAHAVVPLALQEEHSRSADAYGAKQAARDMSNERGGGDAVVARPAHAVRRAEPPAPVQAVGENVRDAAPGLQADSGSLAAAPAPGVGVPIDQAIQNLLEAGRQQAGKRDPSLLKGRVMLKDGTVAGACHSAFCPGAGAVNVKCALQRTCLMSQVQ